MANEIEALPCPFCGGTRIEIGGYIRDGAATGCSDCKVQMIAFHPNAKEKSLEKWNLRAPCMQADLQEAIELLYGAMDLIHPSRVLTRAAIRKFLQLHPVVE